MIRALFLFFALLAPAAVAQTTDVSDTESQGNLDRVLRGGEASTEGGMAFPTDGSERLALPEDLRLTPETEEAMQVALRAQYAYYASQLDHRRDVFHWQYQSTRAIFVVVIVIVLTGLYFSWMQFRREQSVAVNAGAGKPATTTFEASGGGIKISSPVLGLVILTISLVFFYLYLVHVYPIQEIF